MDGFDVKVEPHVVACFWSLRNFKLNRSQSMQWCMLCKHHNDAVQKAFNPLQLFMFEVILVAAWNFGISNFSFDCSSVETLNQLKTLSLYIEQRCLRFLLSSLCQQQSVVDNFIICRPLHSTFHSPIALTIVYSFVSAFVAKLRSHKLGSIILLLALKKTHRRNPHGRWFNDRSWEFSSRSGQSLEQISRHFYR